ncbi:MAG: DUF4430 domain-containing protein [Candidatus Lokiarchaeota archaeon]|nr:DUF4430 domain-containing protein [Candidatus Lokiarchaeota archaeon]
MNQASRHAGFNKKSSIAFFFVAFVILLLVNFAVLYLPQGDDLEGPCTSEYPTRMTVSNMSIFVNYKNTTIEHKANVTCTRDNVRAVTVFDVMDENFRIVYDVYPNGYFITKINDAGTQAWTFTIDGAAPGIACNKQPVCNGSVIRWNEV